MTRRLVLSYLSIAIFILLVLSVPLGVSFSRNERERLTSDVERDALVLATLVEDGLDSAAPVDFEGIAAQYTTRTAGRVVVVDRRGISLADTSSFDTGRDFSTRPEFAAALSGRRATGVRHSETVGEDLLFVAVPVASGGAVHGAVRVTFPTAKVDARIERNWWSLAALGGVVLSAVTIVGFALARSITGPLRRLESATDSMANGELSARTRVNEGPPDIRQLAERFNQMAERVETLVATQQAFVANASHELRTPLTALRLRLENIDAGKEASSQADVDAALAEVGRLAILVDQLLVLARAEQGELPLETVDVGAVVADRAAAWQRLAEERGVEIIASVGDEGRILARAVDGSVDQILDNYIDNAVAVSSSGGRVVVRASRLNGWAEIHVVDEGPGMDVDARRRAFERFWRGASNVRGGTGLGLPIVRELAAAAGGEARLDPAPGGGIDASVRLPACQ